MMLPNAHAAEENFEVWRKTAIFSEGLRLLLDRPS